MLVTFVPYCVLLDCESPIQIDFIPLLFDIHVWRPRFPLNGIKKYLKIRGAAIDHYQGMGIDHQMTAARPSSNTSLDQPVLSICHQCFHNLEMNKMYICIYIFYVCGCVFISDLAAIADDCACVERYASKVYMYL